MTLKTMPASDLVLDFNFYPRHRLSSSNMANLRAAREAGEELPPVRADKASRRVTDGFHRVTSALHADKNATIKVDMVEFPDEAAMVADAVWQNSRHGLPLSAYDRAHSITIADEHGLSIERLAAAMALPIVTVESIRASRSAFKPDGSAVMLKRSFSRFKGREINDQQAAANDRASGWGADFHAPPIGRLGG